MMALKNPPNFKRFLPSFPIAQFTFGLAGSCLHFSHFQPLKPFMFSPWIEYKSILQQGKWPFAFLKRTFSMLHFGIICHWDKPSKQLWLWNQSHCMWRLFKMLCFHYTQCKSRSYINSPWDALKFNALCCSKDHLFRENTTFCSVKRKIRPLELKRGWMCFHS